MFYPKNCHQSHAHSLVPCGRLVPLVCWYYQPGSTTCDWTETVNCVTMQECSMAEELSWCRTEHTCVMQALAAVVQGETAGPARVRRVDVAGHRKGGAKSDIEAKYLYQIQIINFTIIYQYTDISLTYFYFKHACDALSHCRLQKHLKSQSELFFVQ